MKATRYLFTALSLAVLALSACTNDDLPGGNTLPEGAVHITAGIEGVQTRAPRSMPMAQAHSSLPTCGACTLLPEMPHPRHTVTKTSLTEPTTAIRSSGKT